MKIFNFWKKKPEKTVEADIKIPPQEPKLEGSKKFLMEFDENLSKADREELLNGVTGEVPQRIGKEVLDIGGWPIPNSVVLCQDVGFHKILDDEGNDLFLITSIGEENPFYIVLGTDEIDLILESIFSWGGGFDDNI